MPNHCCIGMCSQTNHHYRLPFAVPRFEEKVKPYCKFKSVQQKNLRPFLAYIDMFINFHGKMYNFGSNIYEPWHIRLNVHRNEIIFQNELLKESWGHFILWECSWYFGRLQQILFGLYTVWWSSTPPYPTQVGDRVA